MKNQDFIHVIMAENIINQYIEIKVARVHNLKNIDLQIPHSKMVEITGLSESGKLSLCQKRHRPPKVADLGDQKYQRQYNIPTQRTTVAIYQ